VSGWAAQLQQACWLRSGIAPVSLWLGSFFLSCADPSAESFCKL